MNNVAPSNNSSIYKNFFELSADLCCIAGTDGYFKLVSPSWTDLLGYSAEELTTRKFTDFIYPEDLGKTVNEAASIAEGKTAVSFVNRYVAKDGSIKWLSWRSNVNLEDQLIYAIARDKTEQVIADEKIKSQEAMLAQASRLASLGELSGAIVHEINTPLSVISISAEGIKQGLVDNEPKACLEDLTEIISCTVSRITSIIKGLKAFARDGAEAPRENTTVNKIIEDTSQLCSHKLLMTGCKFTVNQCDQRIRISCRPIQNSQILINLINNAYDAVEQMPTKAISLECKAVSDYVELAVIDSGPGIPKEIKSKILDPFFTTKSPDKGTGLGLSISYGIAKAHGGDLYLDENVPYTRFVLRLPLLEN